MTFDNVSDKTEDDFTRHKKVFKVDYINQHLFQ